MVIGEDALDWIAPATVRGKLYWPPPPKLPPLPKRHLALLLHRGPGRRWSRISWLGVSIAFNLPQGLLSGKSLYLYSREASQIRKVVMRNKSMISMLVAMLIPLTACTQDVNSQLMEATRGGQTERVQELLEAGADVNAKIEGNVTALMFAASEGHTDTMRTLLEAGAEVGEKHSFTGASALDYAALAGHTEAVVALLEAGVDVDAKDQGGRTALMWAKRNGHTEIAELLKKAGAKE